jgi:hypothetical protein
MASEQFDQSLLLLDLTRFVGRLNVRNGGSGGTSQLVRNTRSNVVTTGSSALGVGTPAAGGGGIGTR